MAYLNVTILKDRLSQDGTDTSGSTAASMSNTALQDAIDDAIAEVDARLPGDPYADPAPSIVQTIATDISAYLATLTHRKGNPLPQDHPIRLRHDRAQKLLAGIADGSIEVAAPSAGANVGGEVAVANPYSGDLFVLSDFGLGIDETRRDLG